MENEYHNNEKVNKYLPLIWVNAHLWSIITYIDRWQLCLWWIEIANLKAQEVRDMHRSNIQISIFFNMTCVGISSHNFILMMQTFLEQILLTKVKWTLVNRNRTKCTDISTWQKWSYCNWSCMNNLHITLPK
jgi:hypothetical protein